METGGHSEKVFACGFIVKSPGILPNSPVLKEARRRKIPVFSELEVALAFAPKGVTVLAVSGTNGENDHHGPVGRNFKRILRAPGPAQTGFLWRATSVRRCPACADELRKGDFLALEVSSYQLEDSTFFRPKVACLLNITPDHLEHHGGMDGYIKAKARLFKNQRSNDFAVLNGGDEHCAALAGGLKASLSAFSAKPSHTLKTDVFFDGDEIIFSAGYHLKPPKLKGIHNVENAMAAALCALAVDVPAPIIQTVFDRLKPWNTA